MPLDEKPVILKPGGTGPMTLEINESSVYLSFERP